LSRGANAACLAGHLAAERAHGMEATLATRHPECVFVEFRDGLLAGERFVHDLNSLLGQLNQPCFDPRVPVL
jgi:hypothetical protein